MPAHHSARLAAGVLAAVLLSGCGGSDAPPEGFGTEVSGEGFSIRMPGQAQRSVETSDAAGGTVTLTDYLHERGEEAYRVSVSSFPEGTTINLDEAVRSSANVLRAKLVSSTNVAYRSNPGRDAQIEASVETLQVTTWARYFSRDDSLYVLQYLQPGHGKTARPTQFQTFVETFRFE